MRPWIGPAVPRQRSCAHGARQPLWKGILRATVAARCSPGGHWPARPGPVARDRLPWARIPGVGASTGHRWPLVVPPAGRCPVWAVASARAMGIWQGRHTRTATRSSRRARVASPCRCQDRRPPGGERRWRATPFRNGVCRNKVPFRTKVTGTPNRPGRPLRGRVPARFDWPNALCPVHGWPRLGTFPGSAAHLPSVFRRLASPPQ